MELVRMRLLMNTQNMVIHIVPVRNVGIMKAVKIVALQTRKNIVMSQKRRNIKMSENPCAFCSEYDADIGAPCFFYKKYDKCPIGWEPTKEELDRICHRNQDDEESEE